MLKEFDRWNTSKKAIDRSEHRVNFHEREIWWCSIGVNILLWQARSFDKKRLIDKIGMLPKDEFSALSSAIVSLFAKNIKTPYEGVFEAEASGCHISIADEISMSNEVTKLFEKGELS